MKLVRVHGPGNFAIDEVARPNPGPRDVVVSVKACGICGSDLHFVRGGVTRAGGEPMPLGHEAAGVVSAIGSEITGFAVGDRVLINPMGEANNVVGNGGSEGAFAPEVLIRNARAGHSLLPVPEGLALRHAALVEPLAVAMHGVNRGNVGPDSKVAVFGCGPIGLGAILWLAQRGCASIAAIDVSEERLAFARTMGATVTINPVKDNLLERLREAHGEGRPVYAKRPTVGTDVFFDMAGGKTVISDIISLAQFQARLVVTAVYLQPIPIDFQELLTSEVEITTAIGYPTELKDVLEQLPGIDPAVLDRYISHVFSFTQFEEAFAIAHRPESAKVMVEFT